MTGKGKAQGSGPESTAFAIAALAAAGHQITDPHMLALLSQVAAHAITAEEAIATAQQHIQAPKGKHHD